MPIEVKVYRWTCQAQSIILGSSRTTEHVVCYRILYYHNHSDGHPSDVVQEYTPSPSAFPSESNTLTKHTCMGVRLITSEGRVFDTALLFSWTLACKYALIYMYRWIETIGMLVEPSGRSWIALEPDAPSISVRIDGFVSPMSNLNCYSVAMS